MKVWLSLAFVSLHWLALQAQQFDVSTTTELVRATIGETVQTPLRIRNNDSKTLTLVLRKIQSELGSTQKSTFCVNGQCKDEIQLKVEPGQIIQDVVVFFEAGLAEGISSSRYVLMNKNTPTEMIEFELNFSVDDVEARRSIYESKLITLHDVYPNPAIEIAQIDYKIRESQPAYTIIVRNLLGNIVSKYSLDSLETKLKMRTDDLNPGIYFFTLYIDNEGVMTRKMMVKR